MFKKPNYFIFLLPLVLYFSDLFIRLEFISLLEPKGLLNFSISIIFELLFYISIFFLISRTTFNKTLSFAFGFIIALLHLILISHFKYFGVLPSEYSLRFISNQFVNTMSLFLNSMEYWYILIIIFVSLLYGIIINKSVLIIKEWNKTKGIKIIIVTILISLFFNNNVRFYPQSFSISTSLIFSTKYFIFAKKNLGDIGYVQRRFEIENKSLTTPKFNVLILLSESLRKKNLHSYGYEKETTPFFDYLLNENKLIKFERHTSNAVSTQFAVPIMLSGIFSYRKVNEPFIQDYSKYWFGNYNFLISSQLMARNSIEKVYNTSFDTFVCQERSGLPIYNDMAFNDNELIPILKNELNKIGNNKFFGVVGFNNTHYPFTTNKIKNLKFTPSQLRSINAYDNTILEQDDIVKNIFSIVEENNLLDSTIIIFTSDHGEAFGEHNHSGHLRTLYEEEIDVPLLVYLPKNFPQDKKNSLIENTKLNTSHLDLFYTIMEIFGFTEKVNSNFERGGSSLFSKINLSRVIPIIGMDMSNTEGIIEADYKYIETRDGSHLKNELFNTRRDKLELKNLWNEIDKNEKVSWTLKLQKVREEREKIDILF